MKKFLGLLPYIAFSLLFLLPSCQKEVDFNNDDDDNNPVTGDFRAKIDGIQWVADKAAIATRQFGIINISGIGNDDKVITITLEDLGVGTYQLEYTNAQHAGAYSDPASGSPIAFTSNAGADPSEAGGTLTISAINETTKRMSGTFSFKVIRQTDGARRNITEGVFTDISFAPPPPPPPGNNKDTFRVKIGGVQYDPPTIFGALTPAMPPMPAQLVITGTNTTTLKAVGLIMPPDITPGTYTLDFFGLTYIGQYNPDNDPNHSQAATSGTLTILTHNTTTKRIRGTFNFHAETILPPVISSELTEGFFAVTYQ